MGREYVKQVEVVSQANIPSLALLSDDFEAATNKWGSEASGGASGAIATAAAYNGVNGYRMTTRSAGAVNGDFQGIVRFVGATQRAKYNFSVRQRNFAVNTAQGLAQYIFTHRDGLQTTVYEIHLSHLTNTILYRNAAGVMVALPGVILSASSDVFTRVEIEFNVATRQYEYIAIGRQVFLMTDIDARVTTPGGNNQDMAVRIRIAQNQAVGGVGAQLDVDDVVIQNFD